MLDLRNLEELTLANVADMLTKEISYILTTTSANKKQTRSEFIGNIQCWLDNKFSYNFKTYDNSTKLYFCVPQCPPLAFKIKLKRTDKTRKVSNTKLAYLYTFDAIEVADVKDANKFVWDILLGTNSEAGYRWYKLTERWFKKYNSKIDFASFICSAFEISQATASGAMYLETEPNINVNHKCYINKDHNYQCNYAFTMIVQLCNNNFSNNEAVEMFHKVVVAYENCVKHNQAFYDFGLCIIKLFKLENYFKDEECNRHKQG